MDLGGALKGVIVIFGRFSAEIAYFCNYEPLNVVFGAILIPYPKGLIHRGFLKSILVRQNFDPMNLGALKGVQNGHFREILS